MSLVRISKPVVSRIDYEAMSLSEDYCYICTFPDRSCSFNHVYVICARFNQSYVAFQGHVACRNFTLTGPEYKSKAKNSNELLYLTTIPRARMGSKSVAHGGEQTENSPYFCVFQYARAVKQKVWSEPENKARELRASKTLATLYRFLY